MKESIWKPHSWRTSEFHPHVIVWLDDASRCAFTGGEFNEATSEHNIETFKTAKDLSFDLKVLIRHVNTDRGRSFIQTRLKVRVNLRNTLVHNLSSMFLQGEIIHKQMES